MSGISLNYEQVCNKAQKLQKAATELQRINTSSSNATSDLSSYWEGASANAFTESCARWQGEMASICTELEDIARSIKRVANEIRDADKRAAEIASQGIKTGEQAGDNGIGGGGRF